MLDSSWILMPLSELAKIEAALEWTMKAWDKNHRLYCNACMQPMDAHLSDCKAATALSIIAEQKRLSGIGKGE
jgi:hypothetical protein